MNFKSKYPHFYQKWSHLKNSSFGSKYTLFSRVRNFWSKPPFLMINDFFIKIIIFVSKSGFLVQTIIFAWFLSKLTEKISNFFDIENRGFINSQVSMSLNDATVGNILATVPNVLFMKLNTNTTPLNDIHFIYSTFLPNNISKHNRKSALAHRLHAK